MAPKRHAGKPGTIPDELSQLIQLRVHPQLYKEMKMAALREDFETVAEWLHEALCQKLDREDLAIESAGTIRATA